MEKDPAYLRVPETPVCNPIALIDGVEVFLNKNGMNSSDKKELIFWASDELERPGGNVFENIVHKSKFISVFRRNIPFLKLTGTERVLELGAGHGWASALLKKAYPECYVVASDVSSDALRSASEYERMLGLEIDRKLAFSVGSIPFSDSQFDVVFAFAAFHHFIIGDRYEAVLSEIIRILRPGGRLIMLYEPSSPQYLYPLAKSRVDRKRQADSVDEDIISITKLKAICQKLSASVHIEQNADFLDRPGKLETIYYVGLSYIPLLRKMLPCTVNIEIKKI